MEKAKRNLKEISIVLLILVGLSLVRMIVEVALGGLMVQELPEGVTEELMQAALIIVFVIGLLILLPQIYVGIKGIKESKKPTSSRAHIVWAKIIFVLSIIALISPISSLIQGADIVDNVLTLVDILLDVVLYFLFIKYANKVSGK